MGRCILGDVCYPSICVGQFRLNDKEFTSCLDLIFLSFFIFCTFQCSKHGQNSDATDDETYFNDSYYSLGEDDNLIFEQNVTSSIELNARKESTVANEINYSNSLENPPSDELRSVHSDSEEKVVQYLEFNGEKEMMDPELEVGNYSCRQVVLLSKNHNFTHNTGHQQHRTCQSRKLNQREKVLHLNDG
ncbi:Uncharacterized protein Adt_03515 [Abeliophyllum distichum]|uniref:Uncharacterized protein n=1 Tax=Abeliophyllum distichum TaxID=126358 RepID=A0ABD1VYZ7_9LAMI